MGSHGRMNNLAFLGAAKEVTGSCYLLEIASGQRILRDCGMRQGNSQVAQYRHYKFPFSIGAIDALVLSHAHIDHSGLLPLLVARGYRGPVYCTEPTRELLDIMLRDAVGLYLRDLEWENKRRHKAGKAELEIVGFQAQGTLGRRLVDGVKTVRLFGETHPVRLQVHTLGGFSAHAGQDDLCHWLGAIAGQPLVRLVHGEAEALETLREVLAQEDDIATEIAEAGRSIEF